MYVTFMSADISGLIHVVFVVEGGRNKESF